MTTRCYSQVFTSAHFFRNYDAASLEKLLVDMTISVQAGVHDMHGETCKCQLRCYRERKFALIVALNFMSMAMEWWYADPAGHWDYSGQVICHSSAIMHDIS